LHFILELANVLSQEDAPKSLGESIHQRFANLGGFDFSSIEREPIRARPLFEQLSDDV